MFSKSNLTSRIHLCKRKIVKKGVFFFSIQQESNQNELVGVILLSPLVALFMFYELPLVDFENPTVCV